MRRSLVALLTAAALLAPAASADWASFHGDALNTGNVAGSSYQPYKEIWWSQKGGSDKQVFSSPVIKDGRLIVADRGGIVRALDIQSGFEFWRYKMPNSVEGTPAVTADHVFVADVKGNLKSINLFDGRVEFEASVGPTAGNIAEHEDKVFIGTKAGELKAFRADSLTLLWTFKASQWYFKEENRCTGTGNSTVCKITCVDENGGANKMADLAIDAKPAIYGGYVYFGSYNHMLFAVDEGGNGDLTTTPMWFYKAGDIILTAPTIVNVAGTDHVVVGTYDGFVYMFPAKTSSDGRKNCVAPAGSAHPHRVTAPLRTFQVPSIATGASQGQVSRVYSSPANDGSRIYVGANNGYIYALKASDLTKVWDRKIGSEITPVKSSPAVANGVVVVGSDDKNVYWLDAATGEEKAKFTALTAIAASPAIDGNLAFVAATDGTWYAFGQETPARPDLVVLSVEATNRKVTAVVKNQGETTSAGTRLRGFSNGGQLFEVDLAGLAAGNQTKVEQDVALPKGKFDIRVFADPTNLVVESDESNNVLNRTVTLAAPPPTRTNTAPPTTTEGKGKIPFWDAALPIALVGVGLLLRRRRA